MKRNIVLEFVEFINKQDVEGMAEFMTDDHTFIDSYNNKVSGKETMKAAWKAYFEWFPDYTIEVIDIIEGETCIAAFGFAKGTFHNLQNKKNSNQFYLPAAWKVIIENNKIKHWQVYVDSKIPFEILQRNKV